MYEILDNLPAEAVVLDLCSGGGSFRHEEYAFTTVHVDLKFEHLSDGHRAVQAQGEALPFLSSAFDAVILSHVLEHCEQPRRVLQEVGRILKKTGAAFIAVPDARTFSDRLYLKLFRNKGGHLTLFGSERRLVEDAQWFLGQPHVATRTINSSFSFLNRKNFGTRSKRREILLPPLPEFLVALLSSAVFRFDRLFGSRASVYGWALYFGHLP
jgi:SAM-dependent methyltransferase